MNSKNLYYFQHIFSEAEDEAAEIFATVAETILKSYNKTTLPAKTAIYLFSPDAGVYHSIGLWKNALEHGPDFANPRNFPWTLASCPASSLARFLKVHGPNITLIGGKENITQIQEMLELHVLQNLIEVAIIIHLQNNFHNSETYSGLCKGTLISIEKEIDFTSSFKEVTQYFNIA